MEFNNSKLGSRNKLVNVGMRQIGGLTTTIGGFLWQLLMLIMRIAGIGALKKGGVAKWSCDLLRNYFYVSYLTKVFKSQLLH
jgi:hypothetical protein